MEFLLALGDHFLNRNSLKQYDYDKTPINCIHSEEAVRYRYIKALKTYVISINNKKCDVIGCSPKTLTMIVHSNISNNIFGSKNKLMKQVLWWYEPTLTFEKHLSRLAWCYPTANGRMLIYQNIVMTLTEVQNPNSVR